MFRHLVRTGVASAALVGTILLAGCGGGGSAASGSATSSAPQSSAAQSSAPTTSAPTTSATSTSAPKTSASPVSGKPSKAGVLQGLIKFYETKQGLSAAKATKFAECMVKHTYTQASPKLLKEMEDGAPNPNGMSAADKNLISKGGLACQSALK